MKHGVRFWQKKLNRTQSHRTSLLQNMLTQLVQHERIETTVAKAKMLKYSMEQMINYAKLNDKHAMNQLKKSLSKSNQKHTLDKLLKIIGPRYSDRSGGYCRILKNGYRASGSDRAPLAIIELVNNPKDIIYHMAKKNIAAVKQNLKEIEDKKYIKKSVDVWNLETGEKEQITKLWLRSDLTSKQIKTFSRQEIAIKKQLKRYNTSLQVWPIARKIDESNGYLVKEITPAADITTTTTEQEQVQPLLDSKKTHAAPKSFMEKYFGRFWK